VPEPLTIRYHPMPPRIPVPIDDTLRAITAARLILAAAQPAHRTP
jgi:hypothetical protein